MKKPLNQEPPPGFGEDDRGVSDALREVELQRQKAVRCDDLEMLIIRMLDDFESLERSYGQSLWSTGAGYMLRPRYLEMRAAINADREAEKKKS